MKLNVYVASDIDAMNLRLTLLQAGAADSVNIVVNPHVDLSAKPAGSPPLWVYSGAAGRLPPDKAARVA